MFVMCQMVFNSEELWRHHSINCSENKPFVCDVCHLGFNELDELNKHKEEYYGNTLHMVVSEGIVKREPENKSEGDGEIKNERLQTSVLVFPTQTRTRKKPHQCDICEKVFTRKDVLTRHYRLHTGEKPYQCDKCNKAFNEKSLLNVHKMGHSG